MNKNNNVCLYVCVHFKLWYHLRACLKNVKFSNFFVFFFFFWLFNIEIFYGFSPEYRLHKYHYRTIVMHIQLLIQAFIHSVILVLFSKKQKFSFVLQNVSFFFFFFWTNTANTRIINIKIYSLPMPFPTSLMRI